MKHTARKFILCSWLIAYLVGTAAARAGGESVKAGVSPRLVADFSPYPPMVLPIRIGVVERKPAVRVAVWAPGYVFVDGKPIFQLKPGLVYMIFGGRVVELGTNRSCLLPVDRRSHVAASDYRVWTNNRWYRGILEIINYRSSVTAINLLDLEEYLLGVVPSEMPASWHPEALKAQAVAARSYAWAHMGRGSKWLSTQGYDLVPDVRDQAYKGLAAEAKSTFEAVKKTRGLILKDSGRVKPGFYRAWVGNAYQNLNIRRSPPIPTQLLERITGVPKIVGVTVKQWDSTGNASNIQVMGEKETREVYGVALAKMLKLQTAGIIDVQDSGSNWIFTYRGPGNGSLGLSQHGANMLAKNHWTFDQILQQYYQDADGQLRLDYVDRYRRAPDLVTRFTPATAKAKTSKLGAHPSAAESADSYDPTLTQ